MIGIVDPLIPPYRFERVQNHLYRGGYPKPRNYRFLRRQRLKTILSLIPSAPDDMLVDFCKSNSINLLTIKVQSPKENVTITSAVASQCLELLTDPTHAPLYLHCLDGSNVTGVIVMCLRKLQLWRVASYQNEYLRFEQDGEIIPEESEFVEAYNGEGLVLANPYAQWLWPSRVSADANALPFERGMHPVVPLVRLRQRASTDICVADPLSSLSRSATDPALNASNAVSVTAAPGIGIGIDIDINNGADHGSVVYAAGTSYTSDVHAPATATLADVGGNHRRGTSSVNPRHHLVMARRTISDNQHAQPSLNIAPQILTSNTRSVRFSASDDPAADSLEGAPAAGALLQTHRRTQSIDKEAVAAAQQTDAGYVNARAQLHTSFSTGALDKALSGSAQTESDSQTQTGQTDQKKALDNAHEVLEPVLAALAKASDAAGISKTGPTQPEFCSKDLAAASVSSQTQTKPQLLSQTPAVLPATGKEDAALRAAPASDVAVAKIREIPLSYAVKALAIEGLGM
ncbi:protein-tyrosine-phosphatase [Coemansia sp. IMI 203386]|nr:protein-tyrosine-phosphatase [Coemansia sp. IMI 203386]